MQPFEKLDGHFREFSAHVGSDICGASMLTTLMKYKFIVQAHAKIKTLVAEHISTA